MPCLQTAPSSPTRDELRCPKHPLPPQAYVLTESQAKLKTVRGWMGTTWKQSSVSRFTLKTTITSVLTATFPDLKAKSLMIELKTFLCRE